MAAVSITWVEKKIFVGVDSTQHSVVISSAEDGVGCKPSELLLMALGSCSAYDVVGILEKKRVALHSVKVQVTGEQDTELPRQFRRIHVHYQISGVDVRDEDVRRAIELSEEKYCSVAATLRHGAELTFDYEIAQENPVVS
jgi:putative redox protein